MNALAVTAMQIANAQEWGVSSARTGALPRAAAMPGAARSGRPSSKDPLTRAQIMSVMPPKGWIKERDICRLLGLELDRANLDRIRVITIQASKMGVMERKAADRYHRSQPTVRLA